MRSPRADMMFNDWQITHFHLGQGFVKPNMVGGTSDLLYAHVTADYATLLDVLPHRSGVAQDLLRILLETRPEAMERLEQKEVTGQILTDDALLVLRTKHANVAIDVLGRAFMPGGIMSSGHAVRFRLFCDHLHFTISGLKAKIENGTVGQPLAARIAIPIGVPVRLGLSFDPAGTFTVYDKTRKLSFFRSIVLE